MADYAILWYVWDMEKDHKIKNYIDSIAYCGLVCQLCHKREMCDGCRQGGNACLRNCAIAGCYQKSCCLARGISGCFECDDLIACQAGIYASDNPKVKAFAICIQEDGKERFVEYVSRNMEHGWSVEKGGNYDYRSVEEVLSMLRNGKV